MLKKEMPVQNANKNWKVNRWKALAISVIKTINAEKTSTLLSKISFTSNLVAKAPRLRKTETKQINKIIIAITEIQNVFLYATYFRVACIYSFRIL